MSRFAERRVACIDACPSCKHCSAYDVYYDFPPVITPELFCMLDVSEDDQQYVREFEPLNAAGLNDSRLLAIMQIGDEDTFDKIPRLTELNYRCQFYEKEEQDGEI